MLTASADSNLLDPGSWKKSPNPVFWQSPEAGVYAPGHNSFFESADGKQQWILYHANSAPHQGCGDHVSACPAFLLECRRIAEFRSTRFD